MVAPIGKVLVFDDRADFRNLISEFLRPFGGVVCECDGVEKLHSLYRSETPNWVIVDAHARKSNALNATRDLLKEFPRARVVVSSTYSVADFENIARETGAVACISKENYFELPALLRRLGEITTVAGKGSGAE